jgi:FdhE protein
MTRDVWLLDHPFLHSVADVDELVASAAAEIAVPAVSLPDWNAYAADYRAGVPLLRSAHAGINLFAPQDAVLSLIEMLAAASSLPGRVPQQCRVLAAELLAGDAITPAHHGLFRYLAWAILARYLKPVVSAFDGWRDEEQWLRNYCPTCGEPPAMAQLLGTDAGRLRKLSCGCCRTRWRYRRTGCPFCDVQDEHRLTVVAVEGERGLRLDSCETCGGYLKTYDGEGSEGVLLADWTSLHLDFIARDRGLKRMAASLYEILH